MIRILFLCHGNICRSPMAEFYLRDQIRKAGLQDRFYTESRAVSAEEIGNPVHPGTQKILSSLGVSCAGKFARQVTRRDCDEFDYLILMDQKNLRLLRPFLGRNEKKVSLLLSWCGENKDVADPWYTGDFDQTFRDVSRGCDALLKKLSPDAQKRS